MNHDQASLLVPDLATNRLDWDVAAEVRRHAETCAECGGALALHAAVAREVEASGAPLFTDHPASELLVTLALSGGRARTPEQTAALEHVRLCPTCRVESGTVRAADAAARAPWHGIFDALRIPDGMRSAPALVPALLVLLLAYPAYLGVTRGAGARGDGAWDGGPVAALVLPAPSRGGEGPASARPELRLLPGQAYQLVRIDFDPRPHGERPLRAALVAASGKDVWSRSAPAAELWDAADEAINLIVPVRSLGTGDYRIEIRDGASSEPLYSGSFRIVK